MFIQQPTEETNSKREILNQFHNPFLKPSDLDMEKQRVKHSQQCFFRPETENSELSTN